MTEFETNLETMIEIHQTIINMFNSTNIEPCDALNLLESVIYDVLSRMEADPSEVESYVKVTQEKYRMFLVMSKK